MEEKIKRLNERLVIRILSSRLDNISHSFASLTRERYYKHSKMKFVFPHGHIISPISDSDSENVDISTRHTN